MKNYRSKLEVLLVVTFILFIKTTKAQNNNYTAVLTDCLNKHKVSLDKTDCMNGISAPDFTGFTINGKKIQLSKLRGQVVVLNFWFIACAPCRAEVPGLNQVVKNFKNEKVNFISVSTDNEEELKKHLANNKFSFETIADPAFSICQKIYNIQGYPATVIIDKSGKIRFYSIGGKVPQEDKNNNVFFPSANKFNADTIIKEIKERLIPVINACLHDK